MNTFTIGIVLIFCFVSTSNSFHRPWDDSDHKCMRFRDIVIFGDSDSDTGNVFSLTGKTWPISPPYYKGRFTNGPNWVDLLDVGETSSYAYGSAITDNALVQGYT